MTPLEELQAAHNRLSDLRDASAADAPGSWRKLSGGSPADAFEVYASFNSVGEFDSADHAALAIALHRTIDAQLMLLADALEKANMVDRNDGHQMIDKIGLTLARAINGEAS